MSVKIFEGCWVKNRKGEISGPYRNVTNLSYLGCDWIPEGYGEERGLRIDGAFFMSGDPDMDDALEVYASDPREVSIAPGDDVSFTQSYTVESKGYHITSRDEKITLHVHGGGVVFNGSFQLCKDRANEFMAMMKEAMRLCEQHGWM